MDQDTNPDQDTDYLQLLREPNCLLIVPRLIAQLLRGQSTKTEDRTNLMVPNSKPIGITVPLGALCAIQTF